MNYYLTKWKDWTPEEQQRYDALRRLLSFRERVPKHDYAWYMRRKTGMDFRQTLGRRSYARNLPEARFGSRRVCRGLNTSPR